MQQDTIFFSVIICAHDRKRFLIHAVNSVLQQTIGMEHFEIIVVKNFTDNDIDQFLDEGNIMNVLTKVPNLSNKQVIGLSKSKGNVICFMDDDDLYSPNKLELIRDIFSQIPNLSFLHNGMEFVDVDGNLQEKSRIFEREIKPSNSCDFTTIKKMIANLASYNASSMAISRDLALKHINLLNKTFREVDTFWFAAALDYGKTMAVIPEHLTKYRRHISGLSRSSSADKIIDYANSAIENMQIMLDGLESECSKAYLSVKLNEWQNKKLIFIPGSEARAIKIKSLFTFKNLVKILPKRDLLKLISLLGISIISTKRAITLYSLYYS